MLWVSHTVLHGILCISLAVVCMDECDGIMYGEEEEGLIRRYLQMYMRILDAHGRTTIGTVAVRARTVVQSLCYAQHIR